VRLLADAMRGDPTLYTAPMEVGSRPGGWTRRCCELIEDSPWPVAGFSLRGDPGGPGARDRSLFWPSDGLLVGAVPGLQTPGPPPPRPSTRLFPLVSLRSFAPRCPPPAHSLQGPPLRQNSRPATRLPE